MAVKDKKKKAEVEPARKFTVVRPDTVTIVRAVNGFVIDPDIDGAGTWVAKDVKQLAEEIEKVFSGVPAYDDQKVESITE